MCSGPLVSLPPLAIRVRAGGHPGRGAAPPPAAELSPAVEGLQSSSPSVCLVGGT